MDSETDRQVEIRVLLAEDHHVVRQALRTHLNRQPGITVVAEVADGSDLLEAVDAHRTDLLLMDLEMPHHDPVAAAERLRACHPELKIIVLSAYKPGRQVVSLFEKGIDGYILKDDPAGALVQAIEQVMSGREWISPQAAAILAASIRHEFADSQPELTSRQLEVLRLMARGYRNEQIADELVLSEHTVRNHIANIFHKLNVGTRVEAVVYALAAKLITLDNIKEQMDGEWPGV